MAGRHHISNYVVYGCLLCCWPVDAVAMNPSMVGSVPFQPSTCTGEVGHVPLEVNGKPFRLILDTGSSNTHVAASGCTCCDVSPRYEGPVGSQNFTISFGTGGVVLTQTTASLSLGGISIDSGSFGAIVSQNQANGFNVFSPPGDKCFNTFAGLMGLAYQGQDAGPAQGGGTTNGTTPALLDQMVAHGMPNAFAIEVCADQYPLPCNATRVDNTTWNPSSQCGEQRVGSLVLGGYSSSRIAEEMQFTPLTDEIHYDVQLLGMRVCGRSGCQDVDFPNSISGKTEDDCVCSSPDCKAGTISYCSFTALDSGTDAIYMNSAANAKALLLAMDKVGMVDFPTISIEARTSFWFNGTEAPGAKAHADAMLEVQFAGESPGAPSVKTQVSIGAIFRSSRAGLVQVGISGNLDLLNAFQHSKFPTLLGGTFFFGKTIMFDRSRRQIGIANVREDRCHSPVRKQDIDRLALDSKPTPGAGCRRGTGSGGGCNRQVSFGMQVRAAKYSARGKNVVNADPLIIMS